MKLAKKGTQYDVMKAQPIDSADSRENENIHRVCITPEAGHYFPCRAMMNSPEDSLADVEIWVYSESEKEVDSNKVEPHFHVCKGMIQGSDFSYEIDIEVKIRNIENLCIRRSISGHTSWIGLEDLYDVIKKWLNEKAFDADITNKKAIRQEWNRNNMYNRVARDKL